MTAVERGGPAFDATLRPRDVIVGVQGQPIDGVESLRTELARHDLERGVRLTVITGGRQRFVFLRLDG